MPGRVNRRSQLRPLTLLPSCSVPSKLAPHAPPSVALGRLPALPPRGLRSCRPCRRRLAAVVPSSSVFVMTGTGAAVARAIVVLSSPPRVVAAAVLLRPSRVTARASSSRRPICHLAAPSLADRGLLFGLGLGCPKGSIRGSWHRCARRQRYRERAGRVKPKTTTSCGLQRRSDRYILWNCRFRAIHAQPTLAAVHPPLAGRLVNTRRSGCPPRPSVVHRPSRRPPAIDIEQRVPI